MKASGCDFAVTYVFCVMVVEDTGLGLPAWVKPPVVTTAKIRFLEYLESLHHECLSNFEEGNGEFGIRIVVWGCFGCRYRVLGAKHPMILFKGFTYHTSLQFILRALWPWNTHSKVFVWACAIVTHSHDLCLASVAFTLSVHRYQPRYPSIASNSPIMPSIPTSLAQDTSNLLACPVGSPRNWLGKAN